MQAGQTGYGANGLQNFLFPLDEMYITQGSYTATYSHNGCYAMDFVGWNGSQVNTYPYYAPFDCTLVEKWGSSSNYQCVWQSDHEVNFIDGTTGYACIGFNHDPNNALFVVGAHRYQGEQIGTTGEYGAPGSPHIHIEAKKGTYDGYHQNSDGVYMLTNSTWLYDLMGVNDTTLYKTYYVNHNGVRVDYPWEQFQINNPQPTPWTYGKRTNFPWVLYARKLRTKRKT